MYLKIGLNELQLDSQKLDIAYYLRMLDKYASTRKRLPQRADKVTGADLFNLLYQWEPKIRDNPSNPALAGWVRGQMKGPGLRELRAVTMGDAAKSALAAVKLFQELNRAKESTFKSAKDSQNLVDEAEQFLPEMLDEVRELQEKQGQQAEEEGENWQSAKAVSNTEQDVKGAAELAELLNSGREPGDDRSDRILELGLDEGLM